MRGARKTLLVGVFDGYRHVEVVQYVECLQHGVVTIFALGAVLRKKAARMKRDGGVKSPGRPSIAELPPIGFSVCLPRLYDDALPGRRLT